MKIAVLADIHGNLTALKAVLENIKKHDIDKIIIAGDSIGDCPEPDEVLNVIQTLKAYVIKGNRELYTLNIRNGLCNDWRDYKQMSSAIWTHDNISEKNMAFINEMPEQLSVSFKAADDIKIVHGSPSNVYEHLFPDKLLERIEKAALSTLEPVLICGHTHEQWDVIVHNKLIVNPGSVGVHFNKNQCAEYTILTWADMKWKAAHKQIPYNLELLEQKYEETALLKASRAWSRLTIQSLREGRNAVTDFLDFANNLAEKHGFYNLKFIPNEIWDKAEELWFENN